MGLARHVGAAQAAEEVEIGSAVRLENMVDVELGLPPACVGLRSFPFLCSPIFSLQSVVRDDSLALLTKPLYAQANDVSGR